MTATSLTVDVLGGMGPQLTAAFSQALLHLTPARKGWDRLRTILVDVRHIPSRTRRLLYGEPSPFPGMLKSCTELERYPVDLLALPCNSAAVFAIHVAEERCECSTRPEGERNESNL